MNIENKIGILMILMTLGMIVMMFKVTTADRVVYSPSLVFGVIGSLSLNGYQDQARLILQAISRLVGVDDSKIGLNVLKLLAILAAAYTVARMYEINRGK